MGLGGLEKVYQCKYLITLLNKKKKQTKLKHLDESNIFIFLIT